MKIEELVKQLREWADPECVEAADKLEELVAENERLTKSLDANWVQHQRVVKAEAALAARSGVVKGRKELIQKYAAPINADVPDRVMRRHLSEFLDEALAALEQAEPAADAEPVKLTYRNWRGEVSKRTITPKRVWYGSTEWHPEPQLLVTAFDHDKQADRDFALKDFGDAEPVILSEKSFTEIMGWVDNPPKPTEKLKEIYQAYIDNKSKSKSESTRPPESRLLEARLREALESIANNACCGGCQEAALVARAALKEDSE